MNRVFLSAHWKNLLMINYAVDPAVLQPYLPAGTELDFYNGTCYVSLVGFMFCNTKIRGISYPCYTNFEEFNLRFYVKYPQENAFKRGAVFIKEIVPRRMICFIANTIYGEHYQYYPMKHINHFQNDELHVEYAFKYDGEWNYIKAVAENKPYIADANSEAYFITEHYWGYTSVDAKTTSEYEVQHPQWKILPVKNFQVQCNTGKLYGPAFEPYLAQEPLSAFIAEGSPVRVLRKNVIRL